MIIETMSAPRNVRSDATSYEQTGIPCGNPVRYQSRGVIRMSTNDGRPYEDQRLDAPGHGTESEAERHLKCMVQNQLDTNITLESQKNKRKQFTSSSTYSSFKPEATGALSLKAYQSIEEQSEYTEKLRQYGLTEDEIEYKLELKGFVPKAAKRSRYGANPEAEEQRLGQLQRKIEEKEKLLSEQDSFSNVQVLSRHAMEVEMSLNRGTERAKDFSHLVQASKQESDQADPVLQTLLSKAELLGKTGPSSHLLQQQQSIGESPQGCKNNAKFSALENTKSHFLTAEDKVTDNTPYLPANIAPVEEAEILENRLTTEEIRDIPRFKDYIQGDPSKTLFLKNLSSKVTEEDLVALFIRFQQDGRPKIVFRLMKGRMKGQAFITFVDTATAARALQLVNGYSLKGKPIIIQFGKKTREESGEIHREPLK